jgi:putative glutamine amidotransferase
VKRPIIGITLGDGTEPGVHALRADYLRSVEQARAVPVALPALPAQDAALVLDRLDGVLLSGGADVDPVLYGQTPHPKLRHVDRRRDDFELALVREALRRDRPLLAICRGQQVLNVALGGTLLQDIPSELGVVADHDAPGERTSRPHAVEVLAHTRLRAILDRDELDVNSIHHQAVDRLGDGLEVSARSPVDGVIEGLEVPGSRFVVAVQWHPESFWNQPDSFQCLFDAHAEACRS